MVDKVSFLGCGSWGAALGSILVDKGCLLYTSDAADE